MQTLKCARITGIFLLGWTASLYFSPVWAASPHSIKVQLLGQPCLLQGPWNETVLRAIHQLGPAQLYPNLSCLDVQGSLNRIRKSIDQTRNSTQLPALMDRYREKIQSRLKAQADFFQSLEKIEKSSQIQPLIDTATAQIRSEQDRKSFLDELRKGLKASKTKTPKGELLEKLWDLYNDLIEADPQDEFHRTIKKLGIEYHCSFEESEESEESEEREPSEENEARKKSLEPKESKKESQGGKP